MLKKDAATAALVMVLMAFHFSASAKEKVLPESAVPFSAAELDWAKAAGTNAISGSALLRTVGGDVKTCAALPVQIIPAAPYGEDRMRMIYGSVETGFNPVRKPKVIAPVKSEYAAFHKRTVCDAAGKFRFEKLADGIYFVVAEVTWGIPMQYFTRREGGMLMQRVEVRGGESKDLILSR